MQIHAIIILALVHAYSSTVADEDGVVFYLLLKCTSRGSTDNKILTLNVFPSSTV